MLSVAGAEVRLAPSIEAALETLGSWQPDVLLSDLGSGGRSLIRELRSLPAERGGCLRAAALSGGWQPHRGLRRPTGEAGRAGRAARHRGAARYGPVICMGPGCSNHEGESQ